MKLVVQFLLLLVFWWMFKETKYKHDIDHQFDVKKKKKVIKTRNCFVCQVYLFFRTVQALQFNYSKFVKKKQVHFVIDVVKFHLVLLLLLFHSFLFFSLVFYSLSLIFFLNTFCFYWHIIIIIIENLSRLTM